VSALPPHIGPAIPEMTSAWFKLWLYEKVQQHISTGRSKLKFSRFF
jgi:hypothetical protein